MVMTDQAFRRKQTKGRDFEATYAGALSFLRRPYTRDLDGVDLVVSGVTFDSAVTNRPGTRFGPRAIRQASTQLAELPAFPWNFDPFDTLSVVDFGDATLNPHMPSSVAGDIENHAREILASGAKMLTFGGDHFITYPLLKAHAEKHGPVALLQFDAHCDTWSDPTGDDALLDHGTMFRRAVDEGIIDVGRSIQVGLRTANEDGAYGFKILDAPWVHRNGIDATLTAIKDRVGQGPVYVTFDIDFLDPAYAPGTGTPVAGGFASWQALELVRGLGALDMIGMDLVEVSPAYDHAEVTALAAAHIAHDWICVMAQKQAAS